MGAVCGSVSRKRAQKSLWGSPDPDSWRIEDKMKRAFVLITDGEEDAWAQELVGILQPLGELKVLQQRDFFAQGLPSMCELVIIDATSVRQVSVLVAELRHSNPQRRVVVMTASPS